MYLGCRMRKDGTTAAVLAHPDRGVIDAERVLRAKHEDALSVIRRYPPAELAARLDAFDDDGRHDVELVTPYRNPSLIWGIGLNYRDHAGDLGAVAPQSAPASFIKGRHTIIGPHEPIVLPPQSDRVTAEAELGLVIGKRAYRVSIDEALDYVWGVVPVLDQTAEDILQQNPRFLTRSKNFPTFFSFGPMIMTIDAARGLPGGLDSIRVSTVIDGEVYRSNGVSNMTFGLAELISLHSHVLPFEPGDIISTGTPGAVRLHAGSVVEARVAGIGTLQNPVRTS